MEKAVGNEHPNDIYLGESILQLLADSRTVAIVSKLTDGPLRPGELEKGVELPHSGLMRRLQSLVEAGAVSRKRYQASPPTTHYTLTEAGYELRIIPELARRWEHNWRPPNGWHRPSGSWALQQIADRHTHAVLMALADGPLRPVELERRLPDLSHSALMRRLAQLVENGIAVRRPDPNSRRRVHYRLTDEARRLGLLVMLAARWEWQWTRPQDPTVTGDLAGLLHVIAPLAHIPETLQGTCRLHFEGEGAPPGSGVDLLAHAGRVVALGKPDLAPPAVHGRATPQDWCDSLSAGRLIGIAIEGDRELLAVMLEELREALFD
jgi:DNA-binding HxlR family transcriptional regulator